MLLQLNDITGIQLCPHAFNAQHLQGHIIKKVFAAPCSGLSLCAQLLRDAKVIEQEVLLQPNDMLVPVHTYDRLPSYLIFAGEGRTHSLLTCWLTCSRVKGEQGQGFPCSCAAQPVHDLNAPEGWPTVQSVCHTFADSRTLPTLIRCTLSWLQAWCLCRSRNRTCMSMERTGEHTLTRLAAYKFPLDFISAHTLPASQGGKPLRMAAWLNPPAP